MYLQESGKKWENMSNSVLMFTSSTDSYCSELQPDRRVRV